MTKDLMYAEEIHQLVVDAYQSLDPPGGPGARFYADEQLTALPDGVRVQLVKSRGGSREAFDLVLPERHV